jgi:hypothetical protein
MKSLGNAAIHHLRVIPVRVVVLAVIAPEKSRVIAILQNEAGGDQDPNVVPAHTREVPAAIVEHATTELAKIHSNLVWLEFSV